MTGTQAMKRAKQGARSKEPGYCGLAIRITAGSGRAAWETRHSEPLGATAEGAVGALNIARRPSSGAYKKLQGTPPLTLPQLTPLCQLRSQACSSDKPHQWFL